MTEAQPEECKWSAFWMLWMRWATWHTEPGVQGNCQLQWPGVAFDSAVLSARHDGASQQGVAVSQLTRRRLTLFITCGTRQRSESALTWAREEDDRGGGSDGRAEESRKGCWCLQSLLYPLKTPQGGLPLSHVWASKPWEQNTVHLSHGINIHQCNLVLCPVYWKYTKMFSVQAPKVDRFSSLMS